MSRTEVERSYGRPMRATVFETRTGKRAVGTTFSRHGGSLQVDYVAGRVIGIRTNAAYYRTRSRVGVGSLLTAARGLPGFKQDACIAGYARFDGAIWTGFAGGGSPPTVREVLIFVLRHYSC
jgi:hypothetical protein